MYVFIGILLPFFLFSILFTRKTRYIVSKSEGLVNKFRKTSKNRRVFDRCVTDTQYKSVECLPLLNFFGYKLYISHFLHGLIYPKLDILDVPDDDHYFDNMMCPFIIRIDDPARYFYNYKYNYSRKHGFINDADHKKINNCVVTAFLLDITYIEFTGINYVDVANSCILSATKYMKENYSKYGLKIIVDLEAAKENFDRLNKPGTGVKYKFEL